MLGWLQKIFCAIIGIPFFALNVTIGFCNGFLDMLGLVVNTALSLLPAMPGTPPGIPTDVAQWVGWLFPVPAMVAIFLAYLALYLIARALLAAIRAMDRLGLLSGKSTGGS